MRAHQLVAQVGGQHAPRGQHGRDGGDDDAADLELARHLRDVQAGGAAERDEREPPRIDPAPHRYELDALRHVRVDDAIDPLGGGEPVDAERGRDRVDGARSGAGVQHDAPAEEVRRVEEAEDEVRVGHGGRRAAPPIARGTRRSSRALGTDVEDAAAVDMRDRAATRAQRVNVEARECDLRDADGPLARERGLAVLQERDVRARPAHVERDQILGRQ